MAKVKKKTGVAGERNVADRTKKIGQSKVRKSAAKARPSARKKRPGKLGEPRKPKSKKAVRFMTKTKVVPATKARNATKVAGGVIFSVQGEAH